MPILHAFAFALLIMAGVLCAQDQEIALYEQKQQSLEQQRKHLIEERNTGLADSNTLAEKVSDLKKQLAQEKSLIKEYQLKESLKESHRLSQKIEALNRQIRELEKEGETLNERLVALYENKLDALIRNLEKEKDSGRRDQILKEIVAWHQKKSRLLATQPSEPGRLAPLPNITVRAEDTPEEIREKINLVKDYQDKLTRQIQELDKGIRSYKAEKRTREKLAEFISESDLTVGDASVGGSARRGAVVSAVDNRAQENNLRKQARDVSKGEAHGPAKRSLDDEIRQREREKKILEAQRKRLAEEASKLNELLKNYEKKNR